MAFTRKEFIQKAGLGLLAGSTIPAFRPLPADTKLNAAERLKFGMASYTLRKFNLDEVIAITQRLGLKHLALKDMHLPMECTAVWRRCYLHENGRGSE
jgi:hypothetical protein